GGPALQVIGLTKRYGETIALDRVSFEVAAGEFVAVLGPSGAGKTTMFRCLTQLVAPDGGAVFVRGRPLHALHGQRRRAALREIGLIFQQFNLIRRMSAVENVLAGRLGHAPTWRVLLRRFSPPDRPIAPAALERVGLLAPAGRPAHRPPL